MVICLALYSRYKSYPVVCPNMETDNFNMDNISSKWPKTRVGSEIFLSIVWCLIKKIIPLRFVVYESAIADAMHLVGYI